MMERKIEEEGNEMAERLCERAKTEEIWRKKKELAVIGGTEEEEGDEEAECGCETVKTYRKKDKKKKYKVKEGSEWSGKS